MLKQSLTRRRFLAGCATTGAVAACAGAGAIPAFAAGGHIGPDARPESQQIHTICQGCSNGCGYTAYVVDGKLGKVIGDASNPNADGNLCARGYGFTQSIYSSANIKNPMRRKENGGFQTITWDEAISEVADKLKRILNDSGAESVALIYDGLSTTATAYGTRFMHALGSGNVFVDDVTENVNKAAAYAQTIGVGSYVPDINNAGLIILLDTSYADITTPALIASLQAARASGATIISIDPRMGTLASFADEWIAVNPGTELALLLSVCNQLIQNGRYDKQFVEANTSGFNEWASAISMCTPAWAESVTGVQSYRIEQLASKIAESAPSVAIEYGNGRIGASSFVNSSETARVVCLLNTLNGAWGASGGALMPFNYSAAEFDAVLPSIKRNTKNLATASIFVDYPLGKPFGASAANTLELIKTDSIKALFAVEADIAYDYASLKDISIMLENMDLFVCLTQQMTQTAQLADYLLPVCSYLSSASLPLFTQNATPSAAIANPVVQDDTSNAKPVDEIIGTLADACGLVDVFNFSLEEAAALQLEEVGLSLAGLQQDGSATIDANKIERVSTWQTPTGKIQCASVACAEAGLPAVPQWVPPLETSNVRAVVSDDMNLGQENHIELAVEGGDASTMQLHLISGQQTVLGTHGYNVSELMDIAEKYDLDNVWINTDIADTLGIKNGDKVAITNDNASYEAQAYVTQRIVPTAVYLPSYYGHVSEKQHVAYDKGFNPALFCKPIVEEGYGTLCTQEALVQLRKVGA